MRAAPLFVTSVATIFLSLSFCIKCADAQNALADPDFKIQGEYTGNDRSMQVIARGDGEFDIVVYDVAIDQRSALGNPPRRLDGDEDTVLDLADSLEVRRVERQPSSLDATPPPGAIVLFDGSEESLANWKDAKRSAGGMLHQGTETKRTFRDYTLHLEFRTPWMPHATGQARGNSGVYHQGRYETQVLDSFGLQGADNETGAIYGIKAPDLNACLPPMQWQTYDIDFTAARYNGKQKIADARLTVRLNGITVQNDVAVPKSTRAAKYKEGPTDGPIYLQDHGNDVRYRNIWLLRRDADREATRPIVPGFERFFARQNHAAGLGGELLISTLGCVSCHPGNPGVLPVKQGPDLSQVRGRIRPDALVQMISNPHLEKRGTTMPDPWMGLNDKQRRNAAESIASYLMLTGDQPKLVDRPSKPSGVKHGNELYHSVGCVACHASFDGNANPLAVTVPLGKIDTKYTVDSLAKFIVQPHTVRSGGRMPSLVGSASDAYEIASYLTRRVTERENKAIFRRRVYKGQWTKLPDFDALEPVHEDSVSTLLIKEKEDPLYTGMVFESQILISVAGKYEFALSSDDGSRLIIGDFQIDNDGVHGVETQRKTFEFKPGLYPVRVEWFNSAGGVLLEVIVNDPVLGEFDLREIISDGNEAAGPLLASQFQPDLDAIETGRKLFTSAGCASCHPFQSIKTVPANALRITDLRSGRGCLANSVSRPAVDFHLSPQQKNAIESAIRLRQESKSTATAITDHDLVHLTLAGMNCYACHRRGNHGGPEASRDAAFQTTTAEMGWEGRLPPPLDGVGDKLSQTYLTDALAEGANERPYMLTRMPGFGKGNLDRLSHSITRMDRQEPVGNQAHSSVAVQPKELLDGRKLVGATGLSCIKCHSYNNVRGGGLGVIDLLAMPSRLRLDWFKRYLQDPTKYRPGTRMPNSFPNGHSAYTKLYDGDPDKQSTAMWAYLNAGDSVKEPSGLRAGSIILIPTDRPRIYRNFFEGSSGRGIAVGYPDEVNLIWDAERMGLSTIWKGEFIDASQHWTGRGQGRTAPAGDQIVAVESWTPLVLDDRSPGDSIDMPWPQESGRDLGYQFRGFRLDENGNPAFRYQIRDISIEDSLRPAGNNAFERTITVNRTSPANTAGLIWRIAKAPSVENIDGAYQIGPIRISLTGADCEIVTIDGQQELRARFPTGKTVTVTQRIQW